jgi:hypothetical protein
MRHSGRTGSDTPALPRLFHRGHLALGPCIGSLRLAAEPAVVDRLGLERGARVGAEADAVGI